METRRSMETEGGEGIATEGASRHTHRPRGERRGVSVAVRAVRTEEVVRESISAMKGEADQRSVLQFYERRHVAGVRHSRLGSAKPLHAAHAIWPAGENLLVPCLWLPAQGTHAGNDDLITRTIWDAILTKLLARGPTRSVVSFS